MGATVTEKRFTSPRLRSYAMKRLVDPSISLRTDDLWTVGFPGWYVPALQKTTSYRSGVRAQAALDPDTTFKVEDVLDSKIGAPDEEEDPYDALRRFRSSTPLTASSTYDNGHPFRTEKMTHTLGEDITIANSDASWYYRGPLLLGGGFGPNHNRPLWDVPLDSELQLTDLNNFGKKAISKTLPTLPVSGISTFLGEAHEGLPRMLGHASLFQRQGRAFNSLGSEYLNVQFGWMPFVSDVKKFLKAFRNAGKILDQYRKDSGKTVRRKWSQAAIYTTLDQYESVQTFPNFVPGSMSTLGYKSGYDVSSSTGMRSAFYSGDSVKIHNNRVQKERVWFSGAYSYLLAEDDSFFGRMERYSQLADKLVGTRITPAVLWELAPWSWLLDWEANIGVNITNATALGQDNLVLRWGYVMRTIDVKSSTHIPFVRSYSGYQGRVFNSAHYVRKERIRGTPYGFGLDTALFSERQWAILGALGMTKAPKQLF